MPQITDPFFAETPKPPPPPPPPAERARRRLLALAVSSFLAFALAEAIAPSYWI